MTDLDQKEKKYSGETMDNSPHGEGFVQYEDGRRETFKLNNNENGISKS